ncbi:hypothetical protein DC31_00485 [Microbacterium sp. CH12i]|uniref:hypothetical protein n=1 Tax=Microbacterium sp. CH12i TaxID=1479651 RepID=UPI00046163EC|nr:hypothetical protein [Microbacterium sp. CH12i]KDA06976.1 hypothetical protein DC31_00485 [Microbacterium sp. CH12i]
MSTATVFMVLAMSYGANCTLGAAVAVKLVDTSGFRWLHHALYIATCTSTAVAVSAGCWGGQQGRRAALALVPASVPLALIPWAGTRGSRHPLVALAAAPFVVAGLICSRQIADRK